MQGKRFAVRRKAFGRLHTRGARDHWRGALWRYGNSLGILVQQRCPPTDRPGGGGAEPFARGVAEGAAQFGVFDIRTTAAGEPMRIEGVFVRLAQWRPEHAGLLGFAPGHVLIGEGPHEALHGLHGWGPWAAWAVSGAVPGTNRPPWGP